MAPAARAASAAMSISRGQTGLAIETWATRPLPKKVSGRCRVRSKNWSGTTMSVGLYSIFSEPTAETETISSTPSTLKP